MEYGKTAVDRWLNKEQGLGHFTKSTNTGDEISGWHITVYADEACTQELRTLITGQDGTAGIYLEPGTYWVRETGSEEVRDDYWKMDYSVKKLVIRSHEKTTLEFINNYLDRNMRNAEYGIRFITPNYKEKFRIADGDSIRMTFPAGETRNRECRFIDETHLEVGNSLYHICEFAEWIQRECIQIIPLRQSLPEKCFSSLETTGEIITVNKGEKGYTPTGQYPQNGVSPKEAAAALNEAAGITRAQEAAMVAGSMFSWDTPAADPKNYDAKGVPIKNHRERDAR